MKAIRYLVIPVTTAMLPAIVYATNGMNLEGYGPQALGMGGASMAYDNGSAASMNNPATIGLMPDGHRSDFALGFLGPNVSSTNTDGKANSSADAFYMPALGWTTKSGQLAWGIAMFAQGGMGAEYKGGSSADQSGTAGVPMMALMAPGTTNSDSHKQRSELGVGRLMLPISYNVNEKFTIGGSVDLVWGGLDVMWSMDARNFLGALDTTPGVIDPGATDALTILGGAIAPANIRGVMSGTMVDTFVQNFDTTGFGGTNAAAFNNFYWGHFDFSDGSNFTQKAKGTGLGGKLGFVYRPNKQLAVGGTYHTKTAMADFKGDVDVTFKVDTTAGAGGLTGAEITVPGKVKVVDFQWPATIGLGVAFQATDKLMIAADIKRLQWSDVMKDFHMVITANSTQTGLATGFAGTKLDFVYPQNWDDQTIIQAGLSFQATDELTLRAGYNRATNPIPNKNLNILFPATVEQHITGGVGYAVSKATSVDFSMAYAPETKDTESATETNNLGTTPANTVKHNQLSWQFMYSYRY